MDALTPAERALVADARRTTKVYPGATGGHSWKTIGKSLFFCTRTGTVHACGPVRCNKRGVASGSEICWLTGSVLASTVTVAAFGAMSSAGQATPHGSMEQRAREHHFGSRRAHRPKRLAPKRPTSGTVEHANGDVEAIWRLVVRVLNSEDALDTRRMTYAKRLVERARAIDTMVYDMAVMSARVSGIINVTALMTLAGNFSRMEMERAPTPLRGAPAELIAALVANIHLVWMVHTAVVMKHTSDAVLTAGHNVPTVAVTAPTAAPTASMGTAKRRTAPQSVSLEQVTIAVMRRFTAREEALVSTAPSPVARWDRSGGSVLCRLMPEDTELCALLGTSRPYPAMRYVQTLIKQWDLVLKELPLPPESGRVQMAPPEAPPRTVLAVAATNRAYMGNVEALSSVLHRPSTPPPKTKRRCVRTSATSPGDGAGGRLAQSRASGAGGAMPPPAVRAPARLPSRSRRRERELTGARSVVLLNPGDICAREDTPPPPSSTEEPPPPPKET